MEFSDQLFSAAKRHLQAFGWQVTYTPFGGVPRVILAIIDSYGGAPVRSGQGSEFITPKRIVNVGNRQTSVSDDGCGGIGIDELNSKGADIITLPHRPGSSNLEPLRIYIPPAHDGIWADEGMLKLYLA